MQKRRFFTGGMSPEDGLEKTNYSGRETDKIYLNFNSAKTYN